MFDIDETILSQYSVSPRIKALLRGFNKLIDPKADIKLFYDKVFNILTAEGVGLDIWGGIIGIGRNIKVRSKADTNKFFGFQNSEQDPFDVSPFYSENAGSEIVSLADNAYRELLLIKAAANIASTNAEIMTELLERLYAGRGSFYILEVGVMKLRYIFEFYLEPFEEALASRRDLPPKPAGVTYELLQIKTDETFGFEGSGMQGFDNGVFSPYDIDDSYIIE